MPQHSKASKDVGAGQRQQPVSNKHADPSRSNRSTTPAEALPEPPGSPPPPPPPTIPPDFASTEFKAITNSLANGIADGKSDDMDYGDD